MNKTEKVGIVVFFEKIVHRILSNHLSTIIIFSMIGMIISMVLDINLGQDAWFWFFSSIAQTFAALIALLAIFSVARFEYYRSQIIIHRKELTDYVKEYNQEFCLEEEDNRWIDDMIERVDQYLLSPTSKHSQHFYSLERFRNLIKNFKQKENKVKNLMKSSLKDISIIIILSVVLLPFGAWTSTNIFLDKSLEFPWLKWGFVFGVIGLCIASIYDIVSSLGEFFKIDN